MAHGALDSTELLTYEIAQLTESGFEVTDADRAAAASGDPAAADRALDRLAGAPRADGWTYQEPDDLALIRQEMPASDEPDTAIVPREDYPERLRGAWLGRVAGNMLGKPVELGDYWTVERIERYLRQADAYPLRDYFPVTDASTTPEFAFRDNWPQTTRGNVDGSSRDDDVDYTILNLHVLERYGADFTASDVAHEWLSLLPFLQSYTAERVAIRNLVAGLRAGETARHRNPYREWIGALIRADAFGYVCPGAPGRAAELAYRDASLSHVGNGVYGEMWAAALVSLAFTAGSAREAVDGSLRYVPEHSRLAEAIRDVLDMRDAGLGWRACRERVGQRYGHYNWVHTINNAAVITAGVLYGDGDFTSTIGLTVQGGWDTDSNGATAGSVAGALVGAEGIPRQWTEPLHDRLRSALFGFDGSRITDLASRTERLARRFAAS